MTEFTSVEKFVDIPEGQGRSFAVGDWIVAVFNVGGQCQAINDLCPHMGASLAGGHVQDGIVTCPWHAWRFKTCDGTWCDNPRVKIETFEVRVVGEDIQVRVPARPPRTLP